MNPWPFFCTTTEQAGGRFTSDTVRLTNFEALMPTEAAAAKQFAALATSAPPSAHVPDLGGSKGSATSTQNAEHCMPPKSSSNLSFH